MLCNYARANTNINALIALPSNLLIPRTVSPFTKVVLIMLPRPPGGNSVEEVVDTDVNVFIDSVVVLGDPMVVLGEPLVVGLVDLVVLEVGRVDVVGLK